MKDFTYYKDNKISLQLSDCKWLKKIGLRETRWFLDSVWLISDNKGIKVTFNNWIDDK